MRRLRNGSKIFKITGKIFITLWNFNALRFEDYSLDVKVEEKYPYTNIHLDYMSHPTKKDKSSRFILSGRFFYMDNNNSARRLGTLKSSAQRNQDVLNVLADI
jgi:hypothetical protein